ncbi:L,D-transpeptidase family protein [Allosphingosinicella flava]|uniref:L,D-transpeptidase family protein n=2 Tax=Allosphingosinicella flava TaxID=2771430 RepID=A0A7T2LN63_9SPHN|nr:L,D-transpeptidase family protein [Sphingosinicella flava]
MLGFSLAAALAATAACDSGTTSSGGAAAQTAPQAVRPEELRAAVSDPDVRAFYEARQWQAAWNEEQGAALTKAVGEAPRHGLAAASFLDEKAAAGGAAAREAALTKAALHYADALAHGVVDPKSIADVYTLERPKVDVAKGLNGAITNGQVAQWLASLAPQDAEYKALSDAYLGYVKRAVQEKRQPIPEGAALKAGGSDPRVPAIAAALRSSGFLNEDVEGNRYTPALAQAVGRMQAAYGLKADGVLGASTLAVLNGGATERARTLAINLERRRWLAREAPATRIDVNTAATFLSYLRDGQEVDRRRVVVGQPGWETPRLGSPIVRLIANPPWRVPESIQEDELAGKSQDYLRRNKFSFEGGQLVQAAGPTSALGQVKFDMDNDQAIYLHDTPAKALFNEDERHRSHGCIRVQDAIGFARLIAEQQGKLQDFDKGLGTGKETAIDLPQRIPVRLLYHTAYVENGQVRFSPDAYGWDDMLAEKLGMEKRTRAANRVHSIDVGP